MNLDWLRTYKAVVELRSFSAAADQLNLTQPAASQHVSKLERYFGTSLRRAGSRSLQLTPSGERVYELACSVVAQVDRAGSEIRSDSGPCVVVAAGPTALFHILPKVLRRFWSAYPAVHIRTVPALKQSQLPAMVKTGEVDVALHLTQYSDPSIPSVICYEGTLLPVCAAANPLTRRKLIRPEELGGQKAIVMAGDTYLRRAVDEWVRDHGIRFLDVIEATSGEEIRALVAEDAGLGFLDDVIASEDLLSGRISQLPLPDFCVKRTLTASYAPSSSVWVERLLVAIRETFLN